MMLFQENFIGNSVDSCGCYVSLRVTRGDQGRERSLLTQCSQSPFFPTALCFYHPVCSPSERGMYRETFNLSSKCTKPNDARASERSTRQDIASLLNVLADSSVTRWPEIHGKLNFLIFFFSGSLCFWSLGSFQIGPGRPTGPVYAVAIASWIW